MAKLEDRLAALVTMPRSKLKQEWELIYSEPAPNLSSDLLRLGIAYRLQEKARGGISRASLFKLNEARGGQPAVKPGTRFVRSWNGRTVSVEAQADGFVFEDSKYASLSAIAREVTGTNWSGPRFFGLRGEGKVIDDTPQWRRSAFDIEKRVIGALTDYLDDHQAIRKLVGSSDASKLATAITRCQRAAEQIRTSTFHRRTKVPALVARVDLGDDEIGLSLSDKGFADLIGRLIDAERLPRLSVKVTQVRRGNEVKLVLTEGIKTEADETLVSLLREAMAARHELLAETPRGICQLASVTGRCSKRMTRLVRLSWLAPEIVDAILAGRQPRGLTARSLLSAELPMDWAAQKAALGF